MSSSAVYSWSWETTRIPTEYVTARPVPVLEEIAIPDVCQALLEQERLGALRIVRWAELPERSRAWVLQAEKDTILEHGLLTQDTGFARYMRETYPDSWALALAEQEAGA